MRSAIVIPCLNEQATLRETCASLGFGVRDRAPADPVLILVDNGSTDSTKEVMQSVQKDSSGGRVIVVDEPARGYVPARHRGILAAEAYAAHVGVPPRDLFILQGDADTIYAPGYAHEMISKAEGRANLIVEGIAHAPDDFQSAQPSYVALAAQVDEASERFVVDDSEDIVVVDAVSGFFLHDYFTWGGHLREYAGGGAEIHAETSRLLVRSKARGGERVRADEALAYPSRRRLLTDPILFFATHGFPHARRWVDQWKARHPQSLGFAAFSRPDSTHFLADEILLRRAHSVVLFGVLPTHVANLLGQAGRVARVDRLVAPLLRHVATVTRTDLDRNPGKLFEAGFAILESHLDEVQRLFER